MMDVMMSGYACMFYLDRWLSIWVWI